MLIIPIWRHTVGIAIALSLVACGQASPDEGALASEYDATVLEPTASEELAESLTQEQIARVCQAGMSSATGAEIPTMSTRVGSDDIVRISYVRDDGKAFAYDCKIEGRIVRTRMLDEAGPGTGPGAWSGGGSKSTYRMDNSSIVIDTVFGDGSTDTETFTF